MARNNFNSSSEKEHYELAVELKALKDVIKDLSDKIDRISISTDAGRKETQESKEEGVFRIGETVKLKTKAKYGKRGDIGKVEHIGRVFITIRLQSGKTTTRKPENLRHHQA